SWIETRIPPLLSTSPLLGSARRPPLRRSSRFLSHGAHAMPLDFRRPLAPFSKLSRFTTTRRWSADPWKERLSPREAFFDLPCVRSTSRRELRARRAPR